VDYIRVANVQGSSANNSGMCVRSSLLKWAIVFV